MLLKNSHGGWWLSEWVGVSVSSRWLHPTCPWHVCCMPNEGWPASLPQVAKKKNAFEDSQRPQIVFGDCCAFTLLASTHSYTSSSTCHAHTHTHIRTHHRIHVKACTCKFNERQWLKLRPRPLSVVFCGMKHTHTCAGIYSYMSTSSFIAMQSVVAFISGSQIAKA